MKRILNLAVLLVVLFTCNSIFAQSKQDNEFLKFFRSLVRDVGSIEETAETEEDILTDYKLLYSKHYDLDYLPNTTKDPQLLERRSEKVKEDLLVDEFNFIMNGFRIFNEDFLKLKVNYTDEMRGDDITLTVMLFKDPKESKNVDIVYKNAYCLLYRLVADNGGMIMGTMHFKKVKGKFRIIDTEVLQNPDVPEE